MTIQMMALTRPARIGSSATEPIGTPSTVVSASRTLWMPAWVVEAS